MVDELIGKYRVLRSIGAGGMATVFLAAHEDVPNLKTVLKKLSDPLLADRFKREADKLALLDGHSGICQIKHFFEHGGDFFIVMEYIDGPTLDVLVKSDHPPDLARVLAITNTILSTLAYAHSLGIVHRDIKPTNIMIDRMGQVKIIDFGIAKGAADPDLTQVGASLGSPRYMAPEQFNPQGAVDWVRCDLYAVGVTMYYLLTRTLPFAGSDIYQICESKRYHDVPPPSLHDPLIPPGLDAVVLRAMARDPEQRFATAGEMLSALSDLDSAAPMPPGRVDDRTMVFRGAAPGTARAPGPAMPPPMPTPAPAPAVARATPQPIARTGRPVVANRRRIALIAAAVVVAGVVGGFGLWSVLRDDRPQSDPSSPVVRPLPPPELLAPADGATVTGPKVEFLWDAAGDSLGTFTLQYGSDPEFGTGTLAAEQRGGRYQTGENLTAGRYFWRVLRGQPGALGSAWSATGSFTVAAPPADPGHTPRTDPKPIPRKPAPKPATGRVAVGALLDGVMLMTDAELIVDGASRDIHFPETLSLTAGVHKLVAVYMYQNRELRSSLDVKVTADKDMPLIFKFRTTE